MLEDACMLSDAPLLTSLFDDDAVLVSRATSQVRERSAIVEVIIDHLGHGGSYVAATQLVMQCGRLALIIRRGNIGSPLRSGRLALRDQSP